MGDNIFEKSEYKDNRVYWIWLTMVFGIGSDLFWKHCRDYGSVADFAADVKSGAIALKTEAQRKRAESLDYEDASDILTKCSENDIEVITYRNRNYPVKLRKISLPPPVLYYRGDITLLSGMPAVAVIGTRSPCDYSLEITDFICGGLARSGIAVISGFESGIDERANLAAVESGGRTVGICGKGIFDPKTLTDEGGSIAENGLLVAEFTDAEDFGRIKYDHRNRILCGLSDALLFIECSDESHGLNNAKHAEKQGKRIFAVPPADLTDRRFFGQRDLLRSGAAAAFDSSDIARYLGKNIEGDETKLGNNSDKKIAKSKKITKSAKKVRKNLKNNAKNPSEDLHKSKNSATINISDLTGELREIAELLKENGPTHPDKISDKLDIDAAKVLTSMLELQMSGYVRELPGRLYALAEEK